MLPPVLLFGYVRQMLRNARVKHTIAVAGSAQGPAHAVHIRHSSLAAFQHRWLSGSQLQDEDACVAVLLKPLESQVTPKPLSPIYSGSVPARSGCPHSLDSRRVGAMACTGERRPRNALKRQASCRPTPTTILRRARCVVGAPTNRDFVPWRLSDASRRSTWMAASCRRPSGPTAYPYQLSVCAI
jgi:hypothetical protein